VSMALGMAAMLTTAVLQALLLAGAVKYEQTLPAVLTSNGIIGLWRVLGSAQARASSSLPR
jgi:hypothetical protein